MVVLRSPSSFFLRQSYTALQFTGLRRDGPLRRRLGASDRANNIRFVVLSVYYLKAASSSAPALLRPLTMPQDFSYQACGFGAAGEISAPVAIQLPAEPCVSLPSLGGHVHGENKDLKVSGMLSAQVISCTASGAPIPGKGAWQIIMTSDVQGLDVLGIVTADRITARLSLEQDSDGSPPKVFLLGSQFVNLRIAGQPASVGLNAMLVTHFNTYDVLARVAKGKLGNQAAVSLPSNSVLLSLVEKIETKYPGVAVHDHVIRIPNFGEVHLAELLATPTTRTLTMLRISLQGPLGGQISIAEGRVGGSFFPSAAAPLSLPGPVSGLTEPPPQSYSAPPTSLCEALSGLALHPKASHQDLQCDLQSLDGLLISTPRGFLLARPSSLAREAEIPLDHLILYRHLCHNWLLQRADDARRHLSKHGVSDKSIFRLSDEMAVRLRQMMDHPSGPDRLEIVVQFENSLTLEQVSVLSREERLARRRARVREMEREVLPRIDVPERNVLTVWLANQSVVTVSVFQLLRLAESPAVRSISPTLPIRGCMDEALKRVPAKRLRSARDGSDQIVALLDSGVDHRHPDFVPARICHKGDFTRKGLGDQHGHGTHLAGIIAGNSPLFPGVAPKATIWSYRVLDENCTNSSQAALVAALQDAIEQVLKENKAEDPERMFVVNCSCEVPEGSFTSPKDFQNLCDAYEAATADAVVVVAAGNGGPGSRTITAPGSASEVLTVGAALSRPSAAPVSIPPFSSRGPGYENRTKPDLVAPGGFENPSGDAYDGVSVVSSSLNHGTWAQLQTLEKPWRVDTNHYGVSGTSQATAFVSGVCALLLDEVAHRSHSRHPTARKSGVTHHQIASALKRSAKNLKYPPNEQGQGLIDPDAALSEL